MQKILLSLSALFFCLLISAQSIPTIFEQSNGTQTPDYFQIIDWWKKLDERSGKIKLLTVGMTDAGFPLHLAVVGNQGDNNFENIRRNNKRVILINNGIHPGEPDGIDASMLLARDIVTNKIKLPDNIVLAIIPVYNIGGCLNRSEYYRVDQNGPEAFGFRGNGQNLDLNRDAIKSDSRNARAFAEIFHLTQPDVFVDNHVSNGADYQHVMTLLTSHHSRVGGIIGEYLENVFEPALYASMKKKNYDLAPYVNVYNDTPDNGWSQYWDSPRFASGYASLWHVFSFVPETHMLKPYDQRVKATYALMESFIAFTSANSEKIKSVRLQAIQASIAAIEFPVRWVQDKSQYKEITYKGYEAGRKPSEVSGLPRLYYDRNKPYEKQVKLYNVYLPDAAVKKPKAYILPQGWWPVADLLQMNKVQMRRLSRDTTIEVEAYKIEDYKSSDRPYEMHHMNTNIKLSTAIKKFSFRKGDWYIPMNQAANRFLMETLEPQCEDSYFTWNFFDGILGQKEGYSAYAFEESATAYLRRNPALQQKLAERRSADTSFANNASAQLNFIYQNSPWMEPVFLQYPVYRVMK